MIVPVMAISNLVLTQQIYSEETNGAHAHYREPVPLNYGTEILLLAAPRALLNNNLDKEIPAHAIYSLNIQLNNLFLKSLIPLML